MNLQQANINKFRSSTLLPLIKVNENEYKTENGWVMKRVEGKLKLYEHDYDIDVRNRWVVYDPEGRVLDIDVYSNDLIERFNFKR